MIHPTLNDIGRAVRYVPDYVDGDKTHPDCEDGVLTSLGPRYGKGENQVFVRFGTNQTANLTWPGYLVWITPDDPTYSEVTVKTAVTLTVHQVNALLSSLWRNDPDWKLLEPVFAQALAAALLVRDNAVNGRKITVLAGLLYEVMGHPIGHTIDCHIDTPHACSCGLNELMARCTTYAKERETR